MFSVDSPEGGQPAIHWEALATPGETAGGRQGLPGSVVGWAAGHDEVLSVGSFQTTLELTEVCLLPGVVHAPAIRTRVE